MRDDFTENSHSLEQRVTVLEHALFGRGDDRGSQEDSISFRLYQVEEQLKRLNGLLNKLLWVLGAGVGTAAVQLITEGIGTFFRS